MTPDPAKIAAHIAQASQTPAAQASPQASPQAQAPPAVRWTRQEQALSRRILADRYAEDLQTYGPGITLAALADALGFCLPYLAGPDDRLREHCRITQLGIAIFAQTAEHYEQSAAQAQAQEPAR